MQGWGVVQLSDMGYKLVEQSAWGAAEAIVLLPPLVSSPAANPPPNPTAAARMRPGILYGANDSRRPAGAAVGY